MTYLPTHLQTNEERRLDAIQQERIAWWRRQEQSHARTQSWRHALVRAHREQEIRLQSAIYDTVRGA